MKQALSWGWSKNARRGHAALGLGVFLLLQAMVALPGLHQLIHSDASISGHECAVTLFAHGQVNASDTAVPVIQSAPPAVFTQSWREAGFVSTDVRLLPSRGPPSGLSLLS